MSTIQSARSAETSRATTAADSPCSEIVAPSSRSRSDPSTFTRCCARYAEMSAEIASGSAPCESAINVIMSLIASALRHVVNRDDTRAERLRRAQLQPRALLALPEQRQPATEDHRL